MFEFFPGEYVWSRLPLMIVNYGGSLSEVDEAIQPLRHLPPGPGRTAFAYEHWTRIAERLERLGVDDEARHHRLSASTKYRRATLYFIAAESFLPRGDARRADTYRRVL